MTKDEVEKLEGRVHKLESREPTEAASGEDTDCWVRIVGNLNDDEKLQLCRAIKIHCEKQPDQWTEEEREQVYVGIRLIEEAERREREAGPER